MSRTFCFVLTLAVSMLALARPTTQEVAPASLAPLARADWQVDPGRDGDIKIDTFLGRPALWLKAGTHVRRTGITLNDGVIELDVAPMEAGDFIGITFRRESQTNHENIYIRPGRSGDFMAIQYAPRVNGSSTWQLYREFTAQARWPRNQWTHVRVNVRGSTLEVFVGDTKTPTLTVPRLRHTSPTGEVAFWARVNNRPAEWAAALSNLSIRPAATSAPRTEMPAPPAEFVGQWEVAGPVSATTRVMTAMPGDLAWTAVRAEESGLVNLNRQFRAQPQQGRLTAFLRTRVDQAQAKRVLYAIGYSDDVTVFLNGEPVFAGSNGWESRTPGFASFVDPRFERVWLPFRTGANELILAVTDDQFFGWGASMVEETGG